MGKGRKPIPTKIKRLRGNPGRRPLNEGEPVFSGGAECPDWLDDVARTEWFRVAGELRRVGLLESVAATVLAGYCEACSLLFRARAITKAEGLTTAAGNGAIKTHPAVTIEFAALKSIRSYASEFGITPASKVKVSTGAEPKDDLESFLSGNRAGGHESA